MPTIPRYQSQVQMELLPSFRAQPVASEASFGGGVGQSISAIGDEAYREAVKLKQQNDTDSVLNATNQMSTDMLNFFNGEDGLFSQKGDNAKGSLQKAETFLNQTRDKYAATLQNDDQVRTFVQHMKTNAYDYMRSAATHERNEAQEALTTKFNTGVTNNIQGIAVNGKNPALINSFIDKNYRETAAYGANRGWDKDTVDLQNKIMISKGINAAFSFNMENEDFDAADNILKLYKDKVDPVTYDSMSKTLHKVKMQNEEFSAADSIVKSAIRPDGSPDVAKAQELLENLYGVNATKTIQSSGSSISWEQIKELVAGNESGGNYEAHNNDSGAHGKYQFMPGTWEGVMGDAPMTPENQEKAFETKYKPIFDKYGPAGVLVAVYAGDDNAARYINGQSLLGEGGEYSADAPQGDYPSVRQYVINALGNDGTQGTTTKEVSSFNPTKYKAIQQLVNAKINDITRAKQDRDREYKTTLENQIYKADSQAEALAIINNADENVVDGKTKELLTRSINAKYNAIVKGNLNQDQKDALRYEKNGGLINDRMTIDQLKEKFYSGGNLSNDEWKTYSVAKFKYDRYQNIITNGAYGEQEQAQQQVQESQVNEADIWKAMESMAESGLSKQQIIDRINEKAAKYGFEPSYFIDNAQWDELGKKQGGVK